MQYEPIRQRLEDLQKTKTREGLYEQAYHPSLKDFYSRRRDSNAAVAKGETSGIEKKLQDR